MAWHQKYISIYNKPFSEAPLCIVNEIRNKIQNLQSEDPLVTVSVIGYNEEKHLLSCLWSLSENVCSFPIEIIVVNNNSTDQTTLVLNQLGVRWYNEEKKGPGYARQCGLDHAHGKYHICIDADTMYPPLYIETHVKELMKPDVVCTFGLWSFVPNKDYSAFGLFIYEFLRDIHLRIQAIKRPELCVRGMVFGFNAEYARPIGFRTDILRGEDGSLALKMKSYGKLKFLTTRRARVLTSNTTLNADGSLLNSFKVRIIKALKKFTELFTSKTEYKDKDSNLIK